MRPTLSLRLITLILGLILAACGDETETEPVNSDTSDASSPEDASDTVQEQDQREKQNPEAATSPWNVQLTTRRTTSHGSEPQAEEPEWKRKKRTLTRTKPNVRRGSKMPAWAKPSVPTSSPERQGSGEMASKGSLRSSIGVAIQPASQTIGVGRNLAAGTEVV